MMGDKDQDTIQAGGTPIGEPPNKPARRQRRPTLRDALKAARAAGQKVRSATVENGKVTLVFANGQTATTTDDWDMHLKELDCGKS